MRRVNQIYFQNRNKIENAIRKVSAEIVSTNKDRDSWTSMPEEELFVHLVACILGSRVRYETADSYLRRLKNLNLLSVKYLINNPEIAEEKIYKVLRKRVDIDISGNTNISYPFPRLRSRFIVETSSNLYNVQQTSLREILSENWNVYETRNRLVESCTGIGMKQASLFLRNISYTKNLAILDSHVIDFMKIEGMIAEGNVKMSKNQYVVLEKRLTEYSDYLNIPLGYLDLSIWIVMRVLRRDFKWAL